MSATVQVWLQAHSRLAARAAMALALSACGTKGGVTGPSGDTDPAADTDAIPDTDVAADTDLAAETDAAADTDLAAETDVASDTDAADTDAAVDTDTAVDTDLATDTDVATDTDTAVPIFKVAMVRGHATVVPGSLFLGTLTRSVQVIHASALMDPNPPAPIRVECQIRYSTHQVRALAIAALCPACDFAFELAMDTRVDELPGLYPATGTYSDLQTCGAAFASLGGLPQRLPNQKLFFSSAYGAVYYQDAAGALVRYTDDVAFQSNGTFDYRKYVYRVAY